MRLQGKNALVTGSDSGIGQAIAKLFASEGANVVIHYHSDQEGAQKTAQAVHETGSACEIFQADLADPQQAQQLYDQAVAAFGSIDILVNNAGDGADVERSLETPLAEFMRVLNIDLVSPWVLCQSAAQAMQERGAGVIINITSVHEDIPSPGGAAYAAAKGGLRNITRTLALELAPKGVRINNIAPGMIDTPMTSDGLNDPKQAKQASDTIPLGRPGQPEEIARAALYLASSDGSYVTGTTLFVDGGLTQKAGLA